jgi:hypothetical protein
MRKYMTALLMIAVLGTASMVYAETCDAGNGCSITCKDGCSAIYNHDTGRCSTACARAARKLANESFKLKASHNITVTIKGLKGVTTQEKVDEAPTAKKVTPPAK